MKKNHIHHVDVIVWKILEFITWKVSVEDFSVDHNAVHTNDIVDIYRFSIKETWFEIIFGFIKRNLLLDY